MPIPSSDHHKITDLLRSLLARNYIQDVNCLNHLLNVEPSEEGFKDEPPMPYSGDPFLLEPGNCIAFIGINPRWQADIYSKREYPPLRAYADAIRNGDHDALGGWMKVRAGYFSPTSDIYYGRYFTPVGMKLRTWFGERGDIKRNLRPEAAKCIFRSRVFKSDCVPWLSVNAGAIRFDRLCKYDGIELHLKLLRAFFAALRPRWIQFNGAGSRDFVCQFLELQDFPQIASKYPAWAGWTHLFGERIPVLLHGFITSQAGPQTQEAFASVVAAFKDFVSEKDQRAGRFEFAVIRPRVTR